MTGRTRVEVLALSFLGNAYEARGNTSASIDMHEQALAIARELEDESTLWAALNNLGGTLSDAGEISRASVCFGEALELSRRRGHHVGIATTAGNLADDALTTDDLAAAESLIAEALENARAIRYASLIGWILSLDALLAVKRGTLDLASRRLEEAVGLLRDAYEAESARVALAAAATLAGTRSATLLAAQLWGALDHQTREIGDTSLVKRLREQWQAPSRSTVDAAAWAAAWSAGTKLEPLDALELAATASTPVSTVEQP